MRIRSPQQIQAAQDPVVGEVLSTLDDPYGEDGLVHRSFAITVRAVDEKSRTVDVIASTEALDAYDEVVVQDWDLARYASNPVVLWNHNRSSYMCDPEDLLPIGYATNVKVSSGQLLATLNFVDEKANPLAEMVFQGFIQKSIRAVSVGFEPHSISSEKEDDQVYYKLSGNELYEISACPMGANPEAVAKSRDKAIKQIKSKAAKLAAKGGDIGGHHAPPIVADITNKTIPAISAPDAAQQKEEIMTTEEQKALEAKNAELQAKLGTATEKNAQFESENKTLSTKLAESTASLEAEKTKSVTLNERCATLETERAAQQKRADALQAKSVERDLDELVGKQITPAEKPGLIKLAAVSEELYLEQLAAIKSRPDMKMLGAPVVGTDPVPVPSTTADPINDGGDDLDKAVTKRLSAQN